MTALINELIDKQDNFEIIRDQISAILAIEIANQQALAPGAGKDPADFKLRIFEERSNPWEQFLSCPVVDKSPIVNVWYDSSNFKEGSSNISERQESESIFNIDCYGYGNSADDGGSGHIAGDKQAALEVQKAVRLVRNILMSAQYTYLGLRTLVWQRWPQSINTFQPSQDTRSATGQIVAARIAFRVRFNEFAPQVQAETLELLSAKVIRKEDGLIYFETDYDYTL